MVIEYKYLRIFYEEVFVERQRKDSLNDLYGIETCEDELKSSWEVRYANDIKRFLRNKPKGLYVKYPVSSLVTDKTESVVIS